jgi:hypothetical protein
MARNDWDHLDNVALGIIPGEVEPSRSSPDVREYGLTWFLSWCVVLLLIAWAARAGL